MNTELDGHNIYVGRGGVDWKAGLPTLMMLHGAGMNRTVWVLLGRYFARHGYNVVLADLPGHGNSQGAPLPSIEANALWLWRLLEQLAEESELDLQNVNLCGHSMGSLIAMHTAAEHVDQVKRLLLLGSGYPMPVGQSLLDAAEADDHLAIDMVCYFSHAYGSMLGNNPVAGISAYNAAEILLEQANPGVLFADLSACNNYKVGEQAIDAIKDQMEVVVIAGGEDRMTPLPREPSSALHIRLNAHLELIPDCGHMMISERPEATLQALRRYLC
jgi:pimeloyl-ACP methyl ester carboxylesterase